MKKLLTLLFVSMTSFLLFGCNKSTYTKPVFEKPEDIYAFSAFSTTELLDKEIRTQKVNTTDNSLKSILLSNESLLDNQVDELNRYLNMIELILGNNNELGVTKTNSDLQDYDHKLIFSTKNLLGNEITYEIYYNEFIEEDDFNEDDYEAQIQGIIIIDYVQYQLIGTKEYDEGELEIELKSILDDNNYVEVKYELEDNESKFEFTITVNGEVVQYMELKIENDDDEIEIEIEFLNGNIIGKYEFELEFENNHTYIKIEYELVDEFGKESGEIKISIIVNEVTGQTYYEYHVKSDKSSSPRNFIKERAG